MNFLDINFTRLLSFLGMIAGLIVCCIPSTGFTATDFIWVSGIFGALGTIGEVSNKIKQSEIEKQVAYKLRRSTKK